MGDPKATSSSSSFSLPAGCQFYPSEEQLICCYLHHKNNQLSSLSISSPNFYDAIKEINLYNFNPFELPEVTCFRFGYRGTKRHWYCYTERFNGGNAEGEKRRAGFGFWKRKGRVKDVLGNGGKVILGRKKQFIFYLDKHNGKNAVRTNWIMYEYSLINNLKTSFVACRIFAKSRRRNSVSEHALSSCAEENVAAVRHIGIQHDGSIMGEDRVHGHDYVNEGTAAGMTTQVLEEIHAHNVVKSPGHPGGTNMSVDSVPARDLICFLEGDFIELDDLV